MFSKVIVANRGAMAARIDSFLIEEMAPPGQEIVIGGLRDPQFGPLVMVGLGGIFVEVLADVLGVDRASVPRRLPAHECR